jgi:hypothetical protein
METDMSDLFDGTYNAAVLAAALDRIPAGVDVLITFKASGYATTIRYELAGGAVTVEMEFAPDWARGSTYRQLTAQQVDDLRTTLTGWPYATVWVAVRPGRPVVLSRSSDDPDVDPDVDRAGS